jgi:hypothetical protein
LVPVGLWARIDLEVDGDAMMLYQNLFAAYVRYPNFALHIGQTCEQPWKCVAIQVPRGRLTSPTQAPPRAA